MAQGLYGLRKIQIGKEPSQGSVTIDTQLIGKLTAKPNYNIYRPNDHDTGLLSEYTRSEIVGQQADLSFESDFNFEQAPILLGMAVKGGVTQNAETGVYDFTPTINASWEPDTYTFEYGDNAKAYKSTMVFGKDLSISGSIDDAVMVKSNMYGQKVDAINSFTANVSMPTSLECVKTDLGKVYLDTSWASMAGASPNEMPSTILDFSWSISEGLEAVKYLNGDLFASNITEKKRHVELDLTIAHNDEYISHILPAFTAQSKVFVRLAFTGSSTNKLELMGCFKVDNPDTLADTNGQDTLKVKLISEYDATSGNEWSIKLTRPTA